MLPLNVFENFRFSVLNFFFDISISGDRSGEREVSMVQTRQQKKYTSNIVFRSKNFFFDISISGGRTAKRGVNGTNALPLTVCENFRFSV